MLLLRFWGRSFPCSALHWCVISFILYRPLNADKIKKKKKSTGDSSLLSFSWNKNRNKGKSGQMSLMTGVLDITGTEPRGGSNTDRVCKITALVNQKIQERVQSYWSPAKLISRCKTPKKYLIWVLCKCIIAECHSYHCGGNVWWQKSISSANQNLLSSAN